MITPQPTFEPFGSEECRNTPIIDSCQDLAKQVKATGLSIGRARAGTMLDPFALWQLKRGCARNSTSPPLTQTESFRTILDRSMNCPRFPGCQSFPPGRHSAACAAETSTARMNVTNMMRTDMKHMRHGGSHANNKCSPANWCWRPQPLSSAATAAELAKKVTVVDFNPRFADLVEWGDVGLKVREAVVLNLRRTNLVRQAYSKFHHGGVMAAGTCDNPARFHSRKSTSNETNEMDQTARGNLAPEPGFTLEALLCGVWHYAIGDQEFASAAAIKAAASVGRHPYVILYEDLLEHDHMVKEHLLGQYLAALANHRMPRCEVWCANNPGAWSVKCGWLTNACAACEDCLAPENHPGPEKHPAPEKHPGREKLHTARHMCSYEDVDCAGSELEGLSADRYPCLWKQFHAAESSLWGVPLLPDGTISVFGDCKQLEPLSLENPRRLAELYAAPT